MPALHMQQQQQTPTNQTRASCATAPPVHHTLPPPPPPPPPRTYHAMLLRPFSPALSPVFLEHVGVRHHRRARQDRLRRPQVLTEAPWPLHRVHELAPRLRSPLDLEPEHRAVDAAAVLRVGEGLLGEAGQPRVAYGVHLCCFVFSFLVGILFCCRRCLVLCFCCWRANRHITGIRPRSKLAQLRLYIIKNRDQPRPTPTLSLIPPGPAWCANKSDMKTRSYRTHRTAPHSTAPHLLVRLEHLRDGLRGLALLPEPQRHRLAVLEDVERRLRAGAKKRRKNKESHARDDKNSNNKTKTHGKRTTQTNNAWRRGGMAKAALVFCK